jgi:hypothetical protein
MDDAANRPFSRRTFLIERRFQLKYTSIMVIVGLLITFCFGGLMYRAHLQAMEVLGLPNSFERVVINTYDHDVFFVVIGIALLMSAALAVFGVLVTHRIAGPVYIIGRYVQELGEGQFPVMRPLRRADELRDFFRAFQEAVDQIRSRDASDVATLDSALAQLEGFCARTPEAAAALGATLVSLKTVRDRKRAALTAASPTPAVA